MNIFTKNKPLSIQAKAALWFVACNILQKGVSTITVPIFTRLMTTEQYGAYSVYLAWLSIISIFTTMNLYYGVFNNAMIKYKDDRDKYISSMQGLTLLITSVFFAAYLLFQDFLNEILGMSTLLVCLLFAQLLVTPALQFWSTRQRFEYKYKVLVSVTLIKSILNPIFGIVAVLISNQKDVARIVSIVMVEVMVCGTIGIFQFIKGKSFYIKEYWKYAFLFNLPLLPHYLSGVILGQADRIMINRLVGTSEVALYSVAYNIGMLIQLFTDAINSSFTPWMYIKLKEKQYDDIKNVVNALLVSIACLVIGLMFFAPEIIKIFATNAYSDAIYLVPPVAASTFFIFMYVAFANIEFYFEKNKFIMVASIAAAILNVVLNAMFIPIFGYSAAAYTTLLCYIIYSFSHYIFSRMVCRKYINKTTIYDIKFFCLISLIVLAATVLLNFLYDYILIRYILAGVLTLIVFLKRKTLVSTIQKIR